jgi:hypothetical protein
VLQLSRAAIPHTRVLENRSVLPAQVAASIFLGEVRVASITIRANSEYRHHGSY